MQNMFSTVKLSKVLFNNLFSDFDSYEKESTKMKDWRFFRTEADWCEARMLYTEDRHITFSHADLPLFHCPDLCIEAEDNMIRNRIYEEVNKLF